MSQKETSKLVHTSILMEPDLKFFLQDLARKESVAKGKTITLSDLVRNAVIKTYRTDRKKNLSGE